MDKALNTFASKSRAACHSAFRNSDSLPNESCYFGGELIQGKADLFIFGDSHANHIVPMLSYLAKDANIIGQDYTLDRCLPLFDLDWGSNPFMASKCNERNKLAKKHIQKNQFKYVVLAASWPYATTRRIYNDGQITNLVETKKLFDERFTQTIEFIIKSGAIPIFIEDTPTLQGKSPKCTVKKALYNNSLNCSIMRTDNPMVDNLLLKLKKRFNQLIVLKPHDLYCEGNQCRMEINDLPLYRDDDHLNEEGAKYLAELYLKKYSNPLK